jgi:hypothetical protein
MCYDLIFIVLADQYGQKLKWFDKIVKFKWKISEIVLPLRLCERRLFTKYIKTISQSVDRAS